LDLAAQPDECGPAAEEPCVLQAGRSHRGLGVLGRGSGNCRPWSPRRPAQGTTWHCFAWVRPCRRGSIGEPTP